jgi:hypothetical protein
MHQSLYRDLIHIYCLFMILDMNVGPGDLAMVCAAKGILYHGICLSERHAQLIERRTKIWLAKELGRPGGDIFNQKVGEAWTTVKHDMYIVGADGASVTPEKKTPTKKKKPNGPDEVESIADEATQAKPKAKAKAKVATKAKSNGEEGQVCSDWSEVEVDIVDDAIDDEKAL